MCGGDAPETTQAALHPHLASVLRQDFLPALRSPCSSRYLEGCLEEEGWPPATRVHMHPARGLGAEPSPLPPFSHRLSTARDELPHASTVKGAWVGAEPCLNPCPLWHPGRREEAWAPSHRPMTHSLVMGVRKLLSRVRQCMVMPATIMTAGHRREGAKASLARALQAQAEPCPPQKCFFMCPCMRPQPSPTWKLA